MFYCNRIFNPIMWTLTSEALYQTICGLVDNKSIVLEVGSGTGHISYMLARRGNRVTLNDIREECLVESNRQFVLHGLACRTISGSLFEIKGQFEFLWNSGLVQCMKDKERHKLIEKFAHISNQVLLFYPDTESENKVIGKNKKKIPGVDDAVEYSIIDVPELMNKYFSKVSMGELSAKKIALPYKMYWVYGENWL